MRKRNKATHEKVVAQQKKNRELDRAFYLWITGQAGPREAAMCWRYLEEQYGYRSPARQTRDGAVDPIATGMGIGGQNVWLDMKKRLENGRVAGTN